MKNKLSKFRVNFKISGHGSCIVRATDLDDVHVRFSEQLVLEDCDKTSIREEIVSVETMED